jgi:predicted Zn-dependent peptidase
MTAIETHRFSNGLVLALEKLPKCGSAGVAIGFPAGGRTEKAGISGISHYLEHMIFKGTDKVKNIDALFERVGAPTNATTEVDSTVYLAECPKETAFKTLEMWLQFLSEAAIDYEEFERERGVILSEYFITEDNPDFLVDKNATLSLFKGHPLASTVIGSEETIKAISHKDMIDYFRFWYHPSNAVIWVSGDLQMDKVIDCVEQRKEWIKHGVASVPTYQTFMPKGPTAMGFQRQTKLVQVGLAFSSLTNSAEERASLQILSSMLSTGRSSILRRKLIMVGEFTDRFRTSVSAYREAGIFLTTFAIWPNKVSKVMQILTETTRDVRKNIVKLKKDFERARGHAVGLFSTSIDMRMMWRTLAGAWETLRRGRCSWDEMIKSLETLKFEQFKDYVTEITKPERIALVISGDIKQGLTEKLQW